MAEPSSPAPAGGYDGPPPVGPWPRLGARIIDELVLLVPESLLLASIGVGIRPSELRFGFAELLASAVTTLLSFVYYVWLESTRGQTVGKMALGYRVVGPDGRVPGPRRAAVRNIWMLVGVVPVVGPVVQFVLAIAIGVTISSDPFRRGWHDNLAQGTAVVRVQP